MILKKYINSFIYAMSGISYAFRSQFNMRFHILAASIVLICSAIFHLSPAEWCIIMLCIASVIASELINTSLELNVDISSPEYNERAGHAKDLAAAAVLVTCTFSVIIGLIIFIPKIF
jgi:diacylglycerol kinase